MLEYTKNLVGFLLIAVLSLGVVSSAVALDLDGFDTGSQGDGQGLSMTLGPGNVPSLAHFNSRTGDLRHTSKAGRNWFTEKVRSNPGNRDSDTAVAVYNNQAYIFYYNLLGQLNLSRRTSDGWSHRVINSEGGGTGSISASVCANEICVAWYSESGGSLRFTRGIAGSWNSSVVDRTNGVGESNDIAIQKNGLPLVVYYDSNQAKPKIAYQQKTGGWIFETVQFSNHSFGNKPSVRFEVDGTLHFTSSRPAGSAAHDLAVYYAVKKPGRSWNVSLVSNNFSGERSSVINGSSGRPLVVNRYQRISTSYGNYSGVEVSELESSGLWNSELYSGESAAAESLYQFKNVNMVGGSFGDPIIASCFSVGSIAGQPAQQAIRLQTLVDTDGDNIPDVEENRLRTNARKADSDGDGYDDGVEVLLYMTDPLKVNNSVPTGDSDRDGVIDAWDYDDDNDGLTDIDELAAGTNARSSDTDGDGVEDGQELVDGSNPLDSGSFIEALGTTLCSEWNGFLDGMLNILEQVNLSSDTIQSNAVLYDISGNPVSNSSCQIAPGAQCDLLVHDMPGRVANSYGRICLSHSGEEGELDGRMVYYKADVTPGDFQFAFSMPFTNGISGNQFVSFNTFQPSANIWDASNIVANWIQITNNSERAQNGSLIFYDEAGSTLSSQDVRIEAGARRDFPGHEVGSSRYGMIEWRPDNKNAVFQLRNIRYLYDNPWGVNSFATAFQLEGSTGNKGRQVVPLSTESSSAIIELMNPGNSATNAKVQIYSENGLLKDSFEFFLAPKSSFHLVTDAILGVGERGVGVIESPGGAVMAVNMQYERDSSGSIVAMHGVRARESLGFVLRGSYNTFLTQDSNLVLVNSTDQRTEAFLSMVRSDGSAAVLGHAVSVPANGQAQVRLNDFDFADNYGVVTVHSSAGSVISAWVNRKKEGNFTIPTILRQ